MLNARPKPVLRSRRARIQVHLQMDVHDALQTRAAKLRRRQQTACV